MVSIITCKFAYIQTKIE